MRDHIIVSDLHLGADHPGGRNGAAAFRAFLITRVLPAAARVHLVFLGDMFELRDAPDAARALDDLAAGFPELFATLAECLRRGCRLHLVPGNHDAELSGDHLAALLGHSIEFHQWFYTVPGVLYAEHGHQHHDLNRFPTLLAAGRYVPPLAAWHQRGPAGLLRAVITARRGERAARSTRYQALIDEYAHRTDLPERLVTEVHRVSGFGVLRTARRLVKRALSPRLRARPDAYLVAAAATIHRLAAAAGQTVPIYAFGHTHHARTVPLGDDAWYANTGTWCAEIRGDGPDRSDPALFPYLEIPAEGSGWELRYWRWTAPMSVSLKGVLLGHSSDSGSLS
jgi:UDP-2,3-diacylglucosamine pyrophosphatase LpxH